MLLFTIMEKGFIMTLFGSKKETEAHLTDYKKVLAKVEKSIPNDIMPGLIAHPKDAKAYRIKIINDLISKCEREVDVFEDG